MPWCNIVTGRACSQAEQEQIKSELGRILAETMDKPETGLAVTFTSADGFYRGGVPALDAAAVDLRYIGEFPLEVKQSVTRQVSQLLNRVLGIDPMKVMLVMSEVHSDNWGRRGGNYP
jgi:phenylpyruvate tautomerase PptA (4-oxalocrotonate tautomerase family)